jgi:AcrR family transcriptional regulator
MTSEATHVVRRRTSTRRARRGTASPRRSVFDAALDLFSRQGYDATTIEDIRAASGASTGTIYHHFKNKQALAAELFVEGMATYQEEAIAVYASAPGAEEGVRAVVRHYLLWMSEHVDLARFLLTTREPEVRASTSERLTQLNERFYGQAGDWLRRQIDAGLIRPMSGELFRVIVVGPCEAFVRRWLAGRMRTPLPEAADALAEAAWRAVRDGAPTAAPARAVRAPSSRRSPPGSR